NVTRHLHRCSEANPSTPGEGKQGVLKISSVMLGKLYLLHFCDRGQILRAPKRHAEHRSAKGCCKLNIRQVERKLRFKKKIALVWLNGGFYVLWIFFALPRKRIAASR